MSWAATSRRSFNAIHNVTMIKVDVFCADDDALSRDELARVIQVAVGADSVPVCSAEDIILQKLLWYVAAGGSERQWGDAAGVVDVRGRDLDLAYLRGHAAARGIAELLERLLREHGIGGDPEGA
jgi:hypothetical protein